MSETLKEETSSPDEDLLCRKVIESHLMFDYILESFNSFVRHGIQDCFSARPFMLRDSSDVAYIKVMNGHIKKPQYINSYGMVTSLTKEIAQLEKRDYVIQIPVCVEVHTKQSISTSVIAPLFELPIMVYSDYCWDNDKIKEEIENPTNPGCYFILDGSTKFMPLFEKTRQNQFIIGTTRENGLPYVYQLSETPFSTSNTACRYYIGSENRELIGVTLNKSEFSVFDTAPVDKESNNDDYITASMMKTKKANSKKPKTPVNVLAVIYAILYCTYPVEGETLVKIRALNNSVVKNMVDDLLKKVIPAEAYMNSEAKFINTRNDFMIMTHDNIISSVVNSLGIATPTDKQFNSLYRMKSYFQMKLLPNILDLKDKANTIILMVAYLLQRKIDPLARDTDRNHWGHKGLSRAHEILTDSLAKKLTIFFNKIEESNGNKPGMTANEILSLITKTDIYDISKGLLKDFKPSAQGAFSFKKTGKITDPITMDIISNNADDLRNVLGKIRNNANKNTSSFDIRNAHPSSYKFICPLKLTENELVGIIKFMAFLTSISSKTDERELKRQLMTTRKFGAHTSSKIISKKYTKKRTVPVLLNGCLLGYASIVTGYKNITMYKRYGIIDRQCCVIKSTKGTIEIYCDSRRAIMPVVGCNDKGVLRIHATDEDWKCMTFNELVKRGYIEYFDGYEVENPNIILAQTFASFENRLSKISILEIRLANVIININTERNKEVLSKFINFKINAENELKSLKDKKYTHCALHPNGAYSLGAANLPFGNHQMACRTGYASKHEEQKMNKHMGDQFSHTTGFLAAYNTRTLVESSMVNVTKMNGLTAGQTVIFALRPVYGNQEDACIMSKSTVEKGFKFQSITVIKETLEDGEKFGRYNKGVGPHKQRNILENGMPIMGAYYGEGDCVLGKYVQNKLEDGKYSTIDKGYYLAKDEVGVVEEVVTYKSKQTVSRGSQTTVSIRIVKYSSIEVGNKVVTRHAQKHIVSELTPIADMPFNDMGQSVDIMMSPLCFPTRTTYGTVKEPEYGRVTALSGKVFDVASHTSSDDDAIKRILIKHGYRDDGLQEYKDGITGEPITLHILTGPTNVSMLVHVAIKKTQARAGLGHKSKITGQAESSKYGKCLDKGQKFGMQDRNKTIQYGCSFLIADRMNISCDGVTMVICKQCSSWVNFNPTLNKFECSNCDQSELGKLPEERFGKHLMPQTGLYVQAGLLSIGVDTVIKFVSKEEYLKDTVLSESDEQNIMLKRLQSSDKRDE